ncbi:PorT family protein [Hymenobacter setariae]|uniref:PorT family protein n=1 Tax=Hymenobacter setariae TaxID=2594794 RepID=A0A558C2Y6_9BACT|nr:porin family protein [Hymenobacter setariae]TVT43086.1 PorT family protein [Hymenobacter setariae]
MKQFLLLVVSGLALASAAQAQTTFSIGPRVGLNVSTGHFSTAERAFPEQASATRRLGFEAGLTSTVQFGHFAVQPSLLFSQKGYRTSGYRLLIDMATSYEEEVRLNYLTLPLNLAFTLGRDGQGFQVFAGPYVSLLVGGNYSDKISSFEEVRGKIKPASVASDGDNRYAQRFDGGLQAGVGYRVKGVQVQASYSLGLRNSAVPYQYNGQVYDNQPTAYNRAFQVSLSYLVNKS